MGGFDWRLGVRQTLQINGVGLEAVAHGRAPSEAPTLILLHEGLGCVDLWRDFPEALARETGWGVFAWSRLGYGRSPVRPPPWPLDYMEQEARDWLPAVLDAVAVERAVLFGHSDGASIAAIHGGEAGDSRVAGLILMAPHFFTEPGGQASIAATRNAFGGKLRDRLARYHTDVGATFGGWSGAWLDPEFLAWNIEAQLSGIAVPTLAIQGADDEYGTLAHIEALEARAGAEVTRAILGDCRHSPHLEQPAQTLAAVKTFLQNLNA